MSGVTHGVTAVAELKQTWDYVRAARAPRVTHGVTAVAELKRLSIRAQYWALYVTHGVTAVAELKHHGDVEKIALQWVTHGVTAVAELKLAAGGIKSRKLLASPTASPPWPN